MKRKTLQLLCFFAISPILLQAQVLPEQNDNIFSLKVANIGLKVDSAHGAKVSSLTIDGNEFLVITNNPIYGLDMFWGSTAWIAPEYEGAWPPWSKIDNFPYTAEIKDSIMTFYSPIDKDKNRNEFQMIKSYWASKSDTSINIRYSIINKGSKTLRKAIWEVTRVAPEGLTFFAKGENEPWGWDNFDLSHEVVGVGDFYWMQYRPDLEDEKKFVCNPGEGWLAHVNRSGQLLIKKFEDVPASAYTTNDDEVEYYVGVNHVFLEIENQSTYAKLAPGDTLAYEVTWYLRNVPQNVKITIGSAGLVNFARHLTDSKAQSGGSDTHN